MMNQGIQIIFLSGHIKQSNYIIFAFEFSDLDRFIVFSKNLIDIIRRLNEILNRIQISSTSHKIRQTYTSIALVVSGFSFWVLDS